MLLSHLHPDHYFDLSGLYVLWKYHPDGPRRAIPVWGPPGTAQQVARAYGLARDPGMSAEFDFHAYDDEPVQLGPFTVRPRRSSTPSPAYGLRVEADGRTLAYCGDTGPCPQLSSWPRAPTCCSPRPRSVEGDANPRRPAPDRRRGRRAAAAGRRRPAGADPHPAVARPEVALAEARLGLRRSVDLAEPGATYDL